MEQRAAWGCVALAALLGCCAAQGAGPGAGLRELLAWKQVSFAFADDAARSRALDSGDFVPEHNAPLGLDVSGDRLFVTVPRWRKGVAATLNVIHLDDAMLRSDGPPAAPLLQPYPSWEANTLPAEGEGEGAAAGKLLSVFRVRADPCGRLWALDTGLDDLLGSTRRVAPARLVVIDLASDRVVREYALPDADLKPDSFWAHIAVDVTNATCDDAFAYLSDVGAQGLVVYSWKQNASWRVEHHFFNFDPLRGNFHIGGANFQWKDGLFGVALSAPDDDGGRTAYFHPLASTHEFAVPTRVWQNSSAADDYYAYRVLGSRGERAQSTASFIHEPSGVLFYTLVNRNGVGCWNTNKPFSEENQGLAAHDDKALIFPNDLKVCGGGNLWVLSNRLGDFLYGKLDPNEVNYRIFRRPVPEVVRGTVCE
ncbi:hypothetical protein R5R35_005542 [Gryllus longicercus]|uniref:Protein yellow n=1 Tax=Gryllus longicercus TaxID=2509291 RepID=A0AAN9Z9P4_9ORTH